MKTLKHYEKGCLNCGSRRKIEDIQSKAYDIYLKDEENGTLHTVGLCKTCFESGDWDVDDLHDKLTDSEVEFAQKFKRPKDHADVVKTAVMTGAMSFNKFWSEAAKQHPNGLKTREQILGLVQNVRSKAQAKLRSVRGVVNES